MSKESEDKLPWGLKQSAPGSMKTITKDKIEAFEQGIMNLPKKHLSKKEQEELRKKQEEQAAAELIRDFAASFEEPNKSMKTFVKGNTINPATKDDDKGSLYKPTSKFHEQLVNKPQIKLLEKKESEKERIKKTVNSQEKKRSNLELFKEELKKIQEEREARHKNRQTKNEDVDKMKLDVKTEGTTENVNSKQIGDDSVTTNIFLSNLNSNTNENDLMEIFGKYGPLASVKIMWPRTEEDKIRGANCGFVAFMSRKDAEQALKELDGTPIDGVALRLSWSKAVTIPPQPIYIPPHLLEVTVPPPPSGLPFNAQPQTSDMDYLIRNLNDEELKNVLENATVKVTIPTERSLLCLIHRMIEFVVKEGPEFEAIIMAKEISNPLFRFLFDNQSQAHIYYRWKMFSILQGDSVSNWYDKSFQMFKDGSYWVPPSLNSYTKGEIDDSYEKARNELELKKGRLTNENRDKLEDILRNLTTNRYAIGNAMIFCIDHADCAEEIVECMIESLSIQHTPINKKVARLFLMSDILHNCHVKVANASFYRKGFEKYLPGILKHMNSVLTGIDGKMKSEIFKKKVLSCIRAWEELAIYPLDYLLQLQNIFLGLFKNKENISINNDNIDKIHQNTNSNNCTNFISEYDEEIDGKPLDDIKVDNIVDFYEKSHVKTLNEYDESIDGKPLSDSEDVNQKFNKRSAKFIASKWEVVDPEQLEKQAVTTSKWDFFDEYQSDKNSNDDSKDAFDEDQKIEKNKESNTFTVKSLEIREQQQTPTGSLFQHYSQQKEQLSEEKRQILREIEVQAVKYQDDLESGRVERNHNCSVQEQVENYRSYLLKQRFDKITQNKSIQNEISKSTTSISNVNTKNLNNSNMNQLQYQQRRPSKSRSRSRSRSSSRSKSPSNRYKYSSLSSNKKSRQRSRSNSPSRRYKKKLKY